MRVGTAVPKEGVQRAALTARWLPRAVVLLIMTVVLACYDDNDPTAPPQTGPNIGWVTGSVTLLGDDGPTPLTGVITLHHTETDLELRIPQYGAVLHRRTADLRVYDFLIGNVAPGDYYVAACWTVGCGEYRDPATGALRTVRIRRGRTTRLHFGM